MMKILPLKLPKVTVKIWVTVPGRVFDTRFDITISVDISRQPSTFISQTNLRSQKSNY